MKKLTAILMCVFLFACDAEFSGTQKIEIQKQNGETAAFMVEIMRTPEQLARGLMHVKKMRAGHGMLFDFNPARPVFMWMKNTEIPLDMLFFDDAGRLIYIEYDAAPHSLQSRGPGVGALTRWVLEINALESAAYGVTPGDILVLH